MGKKFLKFVGEGDYFNTFLFFLLLTQSALLYLHTCVLPPTSADGVAMTFSPTPMLQPGIELTLAHLHLFEGP